MFGAVFHAAGSYESFMRAYPEAPAGVREHDLFAGVKL